MSNKRDSYEFQISADGITAVTSTSTARSVREIEEIKIVAGHPFTLVADETRGSPKWGLCTDKGDVSMETGGLMLCHRSPRAQPALTRQSPM